MEKYISPKVKYGIINKSVWAKRFIAKKQEKRQGVGKL